MPGRIDPALATDRIERLIALQEEMTQTRFAEMIGKTEKDEDEWFEEEEELDMILDDD